MITLKGRKLIFTGKDYKLVRKWAKMCDMSMHDFVIGTLWAQTMKQKFATLKEKGAI